MKKLISVVLAFALITCGVVYYTNENNAYAVSASSNEKQLLARSTQTALSQQILQQARSSRLH